MSITSISRKLFNSKDNTNNIINHGNKHYESNEKTKKYFKTVVDNSTKTSFSESVSEKLNSLLSAFKNFLKIDSETNLKTTATDNAKTITNLEKNDKQLTEDLIKILYNSMQSGQITQKQESTTKTTTTEQLSRHEFKRWATVLPNGTHQTSDASYELKDGQYVPLHKRDNKVINQGHLEKIIQDNKTLNLSNPFIKPEGTLGTQNGLTITYKIQTPSTNHKKEYSIINLYATINGKEEKIGTLESGRVEHFMHYTHHLYIACELQRNEPQTPSQPLQDKQGLKQQTVNKPDQQNKEDGTDFATEVAKKIKKSADNRTQGEFDKINNILALKEQVAQISTAVFKIEHLITDILRYSFVDDKESLIKTQANISKSFDSVKKSIENFEVKLNDYAEKNDSSNLAFITNSISGLNNKILELEQVFEKEKAIKQQQVQESDAKLDAQLHPKSKN